MEAKSGGFFKVVLDDAMCAGYSNVIPARGSRARGSARSRAAGDANGSDRKRRDVRRMHHIASFREAISGVPSHSILSAQREEIM
jgi:hypothetical protein